MKICCDRCKQEVEGYQSEHFTSGFYITTPGTYWGNYANPGENKVCDACMWADPRYIKSYGVIGTSNVTA